MKFSFGLPVREVQNSMPSWISARTWARLGSVHPSVWVSAGKQWPEPPLDSRNTMLTATSPARYSDV
jgi:hypothetical protein